MAGRYNKPVQYGRESAHKSRAQGGLASLDDYMNAIQHLIQEKDETINGAREKSAAADSAEPNSKAILQRLRLLFPAPNIGGRQCSAETYVWQTPSFFMRQCFVNANNLPTILRARMFW